MKKHYFFGIFCLFVSANFFAQITPEYDKVVEEAKTLFDKEEFLLSAQKFSEAFETAGQMGETQDVYYAARAWARANEIDSSFTKLIRITEDGNFIEHNILKNEKDLVELQTDKRWRNLVGLMKLNEKRENEKIDKKVQSELEMVYEENLQQKQLLIESEEKYGWGSNEMKDVWSRILDNDARNLEIVLNILDTRGWLGPDVIGDKANFTLYLVMHNANIHVQEQYLPIMREAVKEGNLKPVSLATMEDKVALAKGKKQIYGTQVRRNRDTKEFYLLPLIDPVNVDARRKSINLDPLDKYLSNWGMAWQAGD